MQQNKPCGTLPPLSLTDKRLSPLTDQNEIDEIIESTFREAHQKAHERMRECMKVVYDDDDEAAENLSAPFCGCDVCVIREVIDSAYWSLAEHFKARIEKEIGFRINIGERPE